MLGGLGKTEPTGGKPTWLASKPYCLFIPAGLEKLCLIILQHYLPPLPINKTFLAPVFGFIDFKRSKCIHRTLKTER